MKTRKKITSILSIIVGFLSGICGFVLVTMQALTDLLPFSLPLPTFLQTHGRLLMYVAFCLCGLCLFIYLLLRKPQASRTYGSARFATLMDLQSAGLVFTPSKKQEQTPPSFLELGAYEKRTIGLTEQKQESHVLLVAPTGKRKTSGIIIPGILHEYGNRSLFINDIKGELIDKTAGALSQYMPVLIFRPTRPEQSLCYNPLAYVHSMEDAEDLATCFIENTGKSKEEFWNAAAKLLLTATILHIREENPEAPFCHIADILTGSDLEQVKNILLNSPSELARSVATTFIQSIAMNERLAGSVMTDIAVRLLVLKNPSIRKITASNDISFDVTRPSALFLSIPMSSAERVKWLSSCLIMQMMKSFIQQAEEQTERRLKRGFCFYLDEFANIGVIPHYTEYISLVRSLGISFVMAIQNFGQLISVYGEHGKDTILANSNTEIVFPGCGLTETQYYSDRVGVMTETTTSKSGSPKPFLIQSYHSESKSETQRRLLTADEIRTMQLGTLLVLSDNTHPFLVKNRTYLEKPELKKRIQSFDIPHRDLPAPDPYISPKQESEENTEGLSQVESFLFKE